jgi:hypothetical protein
MALTRLYSGKHPTLGVAQDPPREAMGRSLAHGQSCGHRREPTVQREVDCHRPRSVRAEQVTPSAQLRLSHVTAVRNPVLREERS